MTSTGVVGGRWRATVTEWGAVEPWDGSSAIDWFVAADDRWHRPQHETSTRQTLLDGTPVVETKVRIPGGDAVQRVYSVADDGGLTIIEVTNESTLPIAVAFTGGGLLSRRPPTSMPPQGIDLPADAVIYPIGHQSSVVVARSHSGTAGPALPEPIPSADQVARGWLAQTQRASRLQLPDAAMVDAVTAARCELLLNGPSTARTTSTQSAVPPGRRRAGANGRSSHRSGCQTSPHSWSDWPGLAPRSPGGVVEAAARVLHAAGEHKALADLRRMSFRRDRQRIGWLAGSARACAVVGRAPVGGLRRALRPVDAELVPRRVARCRLRGPRAGHRVGVDAVVRHPLARRSSGGVCGRSPALPCH